MFSLTTSRRPIPGFEGLYSVSEDGRVFSEARVVQRKSRPMTVQARQLRTAKHTAGYLTVNLHRGEKQIAFLVHRAVALAWLPSPSDDGLFAGLEVNHKDGCKTNNHASNLEWCTPSANKIHARRNGLVTTSEAQRAAARRAAPRLLTPWQVRQIRQRLSFGETLASIAVDYGVSQSTISLIRLNRRYAGV